MSVDSDPADAVMADSGGAGPSGGGSQQQPAALAAASPQRAAVVKQALLAWVATAFPSAATQLLERFLADTTKAQAVTEWAAEAGDIDPELLPERVTSALVGWYQGMHGHSRLRAYASSSSASSSEGGAGPPARHRAAGTAGGRGGQRPASAPAAPRRSPRGTLGQPPGPDSLARGAPLAGAAAAPASRPAGSAAAAPAAARGGSGGGRRGPGGRGRTTSASGRQ
jgi:hypothetical protein